MTSQTISTRRKNLLTGEYVLVSPLRLSRPWSQTSEEIKEVELAQFDPNCYLCPKNVRANGSINPDYQLTFLFENDFPSFSKTTNVGKTSNKHLKSENGELFIEAEEVGLCEVLCYSPHHHLNFINLPLKNIREVISVWKERYIKLSAIDQIQHIQIFETRGKEVGNSAPHPHCQIWAQSSIPSLPEKIYQNQERYFRHQGKKLLLDYLNTELKLKHRIIDESGDWVLLVPFWAEWPTETYILPRVDLGSLAELTSQQIRDLAVLLATTTRLYAKLFSRPLNGAPYMMSISQKPTLNSEYHSGQLFFRFISPLLTPTRLKYQAGYEKAAEPQRDGTPEQAALTLQSIIEEVRSR